jgi:hypothetical protein
MNRGNQSTFLRFGLVALVALLALCAASAPASAQTVAINPDGTVNSGVATVTGTLSAPAGTPVHVSVQVVQFRHGQVFSSAAAFLGPILTDGSTQTWTAILVPAAGYKTGQAQVTVRLFNDTEEGNFIELAAAGATVQLHPH